MMCPWAQSSQGCSSGLSPGDGKQLGDWHSWQRALHLQSPGGEGGGCLGHWSGSKAARVISVGTSLVVQWLRL